MKQDEEPIEPIETQSADTAEGEKRGMPSWLRLGIPLVILAGVVAYLVAGTGAKEAFVYSKLVHEVAEDPDAFRDRELRMEGELKEGSIRFRAEPCEWRFVLEKEGREMPVHFKECIVPDTFRDGMGISVTVQGRIQNDNTFLASQVIPRCPSKYEMNQKQKNGEEMPHDAPPGAPPSYEPIEESAAALEG